MKFVFDSDISTEERISELIPLDSGEQIDQW